ncbi:hypothetical protein [Paludisphaera rhizosphaerae]|nr:hypothetical protein [Paludisphaera rhizosphaerae]
MPGWHRRLDVVLNCNSGFYHDRCLNASSSFWGLAEHKGQNRLFIAGM